jgi:hypothetical protein
MNPKKPAGTLRIENSSLFKVKHNHDCLRVHVSKYEFPVKTGPFSVTIFTLGFPLFFILLQIKFVFEMAKGPQQLPVPPQPEFLLSYDTVDDLRRARGGVGREGASGGTERRRWYALKYLPFDPCRGLNSLLFAQYLENKTNIITLRRQMPLPAYFF